MKTKYVWVSTRKSFERKCVEKQSKAKQSKAKQSKAKQSKAKQSKAKQSKAKQPNLHEYAYLFATVSGSAPSSESEHNVVTVTTNALHTSGTVALPGGPGDWLEAEASAVSKSELSSTLTLNFNRTPCTAVLGRGSCQWPWGTQASLALAS
jgi:hypothetical protein